MLHGGKTSGTALLSLTAWIVVGLLSCRLSCADQFKKAADFYRAHDFQKAVEAFGEFVSDNSEDKRAMTATFFMAEALMELQLYSSAHEAYDLFLTVAADDASQLRRARFRLGESAYMAHQWEAAAEALKTFHEKHPHDGLNAYSLPYLAEILNRSGDHSSAKDAYQEALKRFADGPLASNCQFGLARCLESTDNFDAARDIYRQLSQQDEHRSRARFYVALLEYNAGEFATAELQLTQILNEPSKTYEFESYYWRGMGRFATGNHQMAIEDFDRALTFVEPDEQPYDKLQKYRAESMKSLGSQIAKSTSDERIEDLLQKADLQEVEQELLRPDLVTTVQSVDRYWFQLSSAYQKIGDSIGCHRCLQKICDQFRESPYWHESTLRLARLAVKNEEFDRASRLCDSFLAHAPPADLVPHAIYLRGRLAASQADWPAVVEHMRQLDADHPGHSLQSRALFWMAEGYFRQDEWGSAEPVLLRLSEDRTLRGESWLGMVDLRLAQIEAHRDSWQTALDRASAIAEQHPDFQQQFEVDYLIGRCHASLGEFTAAQSAYASVIRSTQAAKSETAAMAQWMLGESYLHQGNYESALAEFLRVEVLHDWPQWQACGLFQASRCYTELNRPRPAAETLSRLLEKYPHTRFAKDASSRLREIQASREYQVARQPDSTSRQE